MSARVRRPCGELPAAGLRISETLELAESDLRGGRPQWWPGMVAASDGGRQRREAQERS